MSVPAPQSFAKAYEAALGARGLIVVTLLQVASLALAWWLGPQPRDPAAASMETVWQVHATFASVGFAGLAIAFQVLGDPPLSAGSARQSVVAYLSFRRLLASGVLSNVVIGASAIWFANRATVAVAFVGVLVPSVALVAAAYGRLAHLFTTSMLIEKLTLAELERRMLAASTAAAAQEEAVTQVIEEIDAELGLVSGALPTEVNLPVRQVLSPYPAAFVASLRIGTMRRAADWIFDRASRSGGPAAYESSKRVSVRVRPHRQCRPGDVLFEMHAWPGLSSADWAVVDRYLLSSVLFVSASEYDSRTVFEEEMAALQDSVLAAVRDQQLARLERGFKYHHHVIDAARRGNDPSAGLRDPRWFDMQMWEIDEAAAAASDRFALVVISDAQRMAMTAVNTGDVPWLQVALIRIQHAWSTMLQTKPTGAKNALESLLISLQNLGEFAVPLARTSPETTGAATRAVVDAFASLAKEAFDANEASATDRVLGYMSGLWDLNRDEASARFGVRVATAQAAVLAWMLMSHQRTSTAGTVDEVPLNAFRRRYRAPDLLEVARSYQDARDESPWRFWESRDALPLRAQVLKFDEFYWRALLLLGAKGCLAVQAHRVTAEDRYVLRAMIDAEAGVLDVWDANQATREPLDVFLSQLRALVADLDQQRRQEDAAQDISTKKMDSFLEALAATVTGGARLADFLQHDRKLDGDQAGGTERPATAPPSPPGVPADRSEAVETEDRFRVVGRIFNGIPRTFFIESEVLAFSDTLGQQIGATILREQDVHVLGTLLNDEIVVEVASEVLREEVAKRASSFEDPVIVYNGQPNVEELLHLNFDAEDRVTVGGFPAYALYIGGSELLDGLLLIDRSTTPTFVFAPEPKPGMRPVPGTDVSVDVRAADPVPAAEGTGQTGATQGQGDHDEPMMSIETGQVMRYTADTTSVVHIKVVDADGAEELPRA